MVGPLARNAPRIQLIMKSNFVLLATVLMILGAAPGARAGWFADLWQTQDQQAQSAFDKEDYGRAAKLFTDPMRRGVAQFRAGEFKAAAATFGRVASPEGAFNRGNALIMLGKYKEAIIAFDRALTKRPEWEEAKTNRRIAAVRAKRKEDAGEDRGGPTELGADDVVFDESAKKESGGDETEDEAGAGDSLSDKEIQAMWLRRVQTRPADFLRSKFAFQYARSQAEKTGEGGGAKK